MRSYIPEKKPKGRRNWADKIEEQQAVYANPGGGCETRTARVLRRSGELVERSFAHCYETGGMRRCHLRGRENILKRQMVHGSAANLSLILRHLLGSGTPRELRNAGAGSLYAFFCCSRNRNLRRAFAAAVPPIRLPRALQDHAPG